MTAPRCDGRSVQSAACLLWRRFGALAWLAAYTRQWLALLPAPAAMCPDADGSPCEACPACPPNPPS